MLRQEINHRSLSDFAFVGQRPYIRGVDLFKFFLNQQEPDSPRFPSEVRSLKLTRELKRNGFWINDRDNEIDRLQIEPSAILEYVDTKGIRERASFLETGPAISRNVEDGPKCLMTVNSTGIFAGNAKLAQHLDAPGILDGLVTANKALHASTLQELGLKSDSIRFVYVERFPIALTPQSDTVEIVITHRGVREREGRIYTLNAARIICEAGPATTMICFSYDNGSQT